MQALFRSKNIVVNGLRKRNEYRALKRESRRLKLMNTLSPDFTGESNLHFWAEPKKIRMLGKMYEEQRNKHRYTVKVEDKDKPIFKKTFDELAEREYSYKTKQEYWVKQFQKTVEKCKKEADSLPFNLKNEIYATHTEERIQSELLTDFNMYYDQIMRLHPEEIAQNYILANRLVKVAFDKLNQGE